MDLDTVHAANGALVSLSCVDLLFVVCIFLLLLFTESFVVVVLFLFVHNKIILMYM